MTLPLWVLAILAMAIGVYFTLHRHVPLESTGAEFASPGWLTPLAVALGLGGILLAWLTYQRRAISPDSLASMFGPIRYAALRGFWVDDVFVAGYRVGVLAFSRIVGWLDRYIVDGLVNVVSAWTVMAGDRLRQIQTGRVQDYVFGVAVGVLLVLWWLGGTL
jgi:NADH:ubiquinone oxidoreductase subunit 5 (subunit L)/multisubunit Na+/H+ antiporter MnhA subunit